MVAAGRPRGCGGYIARPCSPREPRLRVWQRSKVQRRPTATRAHRALAPAPLADSKRPSSFSRPRPLPRTRTTARVIVDPLPGPLWTYSKTSATKSTRPLPRLQDSRTPATDESCPRARALRSGTTQAQALSTATTDLTRTFPGRAPLAYREQAKGRPRGFRKVRPGLWDLPWSCGG